MKTNENQAAKLLACAGVAMGMRLGSVSVPYGFNVITLLSSLFLLLLTLLFFLLLSVIAFALVVVCRYCLSNIVIVINIESFVVRLCT